MVQIHEFSTGIKAERTANGSWISRGFTGQYLNSTLDEIPYTVQRSIVNKEFAVAEGAYSDAPAMVARVVPGDAGRGVPNWSVLALVTRAQDEFERPLSVYRYFLCKEQDGLRIILSWIKTYEIQSGQKPVFNPFEIKVQGHSNEYTGHITPTSPFKSETEEWLQNQPLPIVLLTGQSPEVIHEIATKRANNQPISWAFNVEALEQPGRFIVILAASEKAQQLIEQSAMSNSKNTAPLVVDEQALKSAIKGLINSSQVKPELIETLVSSIANEKVTKEYWQSIFDGQGATNAIKQGIYSPQMARLLTLRAIAIPETLPEYLSWLKVEENINQTTPGQIISVTSAFQAQLSPFLVSFTPITSKVFSGVEAILLQLLERKISLESVFWLLTISGGVWKAYCPEVVEGIKTDLGIIHKSLRMYNSNDPANIDSLTFKNGIWEELKTYRQYKSNYSRNYKGFYEPFALLFQKLKEFHLSAYFWQITNGVVPKKVFVKGFGGKTMRGSAYGLTVVREITLMESILFYANKYSIFIGAILFLIILFQIIVLFFYPFPWTKEAVTASLSAGNALSSTPVVSPRTSASPSPETNSPLSTSRISQADLTKAQSRFEQPTKRAILQIKKQIQAKNSSILEEEIIDEFKKILSEPSLDKKIFQSDPADPATQKKWIEAIYKYQKIKLQVKAPDGVLDLPPRGKAAIQLQIDVEKVFFPPEESNLPSNRY